MLSANLFHLVYQGFGDETPAGERTERLSWQQNYTFGLTDETVTVHIENRASRCSRRTQWARNAPQLKVAYKTLTRTRAPAASRNGMHSKHGGYWFRIPSPSDAVPFFRTGDLARVCSTSMQNRRWLYLILSLISASLAST